MLVNGLIRLGTTNDGGTCIGQRGSALLPTGRLFVYLSERLKIIIVILHHRTDGVCVRLTSGRRDITSLTNPRWIWHNRYDHCKQAANIQMPPLHRGNGQTLPVVLSGSCRRDVRYIDNWLYVLKTSFPVTTLTSLH